MPLIPLVSAGLYYGGESFKYSTSFIVENVSAVTLPGGTAWVEDKHIRIFEVRILPRNQSQLIGLTMNLSSSGRIYWVDCIVSQAAGNYTSPAILYRTSEGYTASCDFRSVWGELTDILPVDPSYLRFFKGNEFNVSLKFIVGENASVRVEGLKAFLYRSKEPTNFVVLETPDGYELKIEPVKFSSFVIRASFREDAVLSFLGSNDDSDGMNLTFQRCNWSDYGGVIVQFISDDPRVPYKGRHLLVDTFDCSEIVQSQIPDFKRRWAVFDGIHVRKLDDVRSVFFAGTLYDPPTGREELRYWGVWLGLSLLIGLAIGIGVGWVLWKRR
ncbi:hypothetical protein A3L10_08625 [Thermococcus radiotolerans]|uniref:Uncharacterized protein n=1 Tax=Thermococcus radiotolerans TaxID=187880 RepID=A0A2Z2MZF9_9EURY|nr:hypothetical protein A3L10_08625 [Thermococcus radiotolerans]